MADRIERFEVLTPAGTTKAAPLTTSLSFSEGIVERLEVLVPPGPRGFAGFKILHSQQVIIPRTGAAWIVSDNFTHDWQLSHYPTGDKWSIQTHNTDVFDHTFYLTFHINEIAKNAFPLVAAVSIDPFGLVQGH